MTMPHLVTCSHQEDGWCLDCVGELWREWEMATEKIKELEWLSCCKDEIFVKSYDPIKD